MFKEGYSRKGEKVDYLTAHSLLYSGYELRSEESLKLVKENIDKFDCPTEFKERVKKTIEDLENDYQGLSYEEREKKAREKLESRFSGEEDRENFNAFEKWLTEGVDVTKESNAERWKRRYSY
ncbi:9338_t:CDS:1 [Funneliformis geosporum]|nr:9338_t:CDS:1 [Funneliformis geosporum]